MPTQIRITHDKPTVLRLMKALKWQDFNYNHVQPDTEYIQTYMSKECPLISPRILLYARFTSFKSKYFICHRASWVC